MLATKLQSIRITVLTFGGFHPHCFPLKELGKEYQGKEQ